MKILMLTDRMDCGGAETHIFTLAAELCRRGHSVTVASSGGALSKRLCAIGVQHIYLPLHSHSPIDALKCVVALDKIISRGGFDIVHSHARLPSFIAARLAKRRNICFVTTAHARFLAKGIRQRLSCWGEQTIAVSEDLKGYLTASYDLPPEKVTVISNGIDEEIFYPPTVKKSGVPRICFLSRLDKDSSVGAFLLCEAATELYRRHRRLEIVIGGGGSQYGEIKNMAQDVNKELGFDCIRLMGYVDTPAELFRSSDVFVGVSRCALEAAFCGLSVVLCGNEGFFGELRADNLHSAALGNLCGRGCEPATSQALLESLDCILYDRTGSMQRRKELRTAVVERYRLKYIAEQTEQFYEKALRERKRRGDRVLLCGYYGFGNMGDEALLRGALLRCRKELSENIAALTRRGYKDSERYGVKCIPRKSPLSLLKELMQCKYFVLGGGTLLQSSTSRRSLVYYTLLLRMARMLGADCRLWGNGIGELKGSFEKRMVREALRCCSYIGLRDRLSKQVACELTGREGDMVLEDDLTAFLLPCSCSRVEFLLRELFGHSGRVHDFLICAPKGGDQAGLEKMKKALAEARASGMSIVFVPMYEREDMVICKQLCDEYGGTLLCGSSYEDLLGLLPYSRGVYSMRFHALLAAHRQGVPHKAFGSDPKLILSP